jgi:hypothetical protein
MVPAPDRMVCWKLIISPTFEVSKVPQGLSHLGYSIPNNDGSTNLSKEMLNVHKDCFLYASFHKSSKWSFFDIPKQTNMAIKIMQLRYMTTIRKTPPYSRKKLSGKL